MNAALPLIASADIEAARALIESEKLRFEPKYDRLVGVFESGRLIGCGARDGRVLKMLVVHAEHRGGNVLGDIVTALMRDGGGWATGGYFVFAKPCAVRAFANLHFRLLLQHTALGIGLLESGNGLSQYLRKHARCVRTGENGAVIVNADPFSRAQQHLVETAAPQVDTLYVLVPQEGSYLFDHRARLELARLGTAHLANVQLLDAGPYILNAATFPGYFLAPGQDREQLRVEMDTQLFAQHLAPYFHISKRFVGAEPLDPATREHHTIMQRTLACHGIRLMDIPQLRIGDVWVSTTQLRRALSGGDFARVQTLVPECTLDYLRTLCESAAGAGAGDIR